MAQVHLTGKDVFVPEQGHDKIHRSLFLFSRTSRLRLSSGDCNGLGHISDRFNRLKISSGEKGSTRRDYVCLYLYFVVRKRER